MGRKARGVDKEFSKNDKLRHENRKLREEISRLRKQLGRLSPSDDSGDEEDSQPVEKTEVSAKKRTCYECRLGVLKFVEYQKANVSWYLRRCNKCGHRTRGKRLLPDTSRE